MSKKLLVTACPLCGSKKPTDYDIVFPANFTMGEVPKLFSARRLPDKIHYQLVKCKKDGMIRSNPVLDFATLAKLYKQSAFTYQREVKNLVTTYITALEPVLQKLKPNDAILEIGCGSGFILEALQKRSFKKVRGVEPSVDAISHAAPTVKKNIVNKPFSAKSFPPRSFSLVFFLQTLDHIPNPDKFLKDCYTVLKPGGYILSYHHNVESFSAKLLQERSPIFDIEHTHLYSLKTTQALFEKYGFEVEKIYSPKNTISLSHLVWLLPLPRATKQILITSKSATLQKMLHTSLTFSLGNICIIARKPAKRV